MKYAEHLGRLLIFVPLMTPEAKREALLNAVEVIGREGLAHRLAVSITTLESWIRRDAPMPDGKLFVLGAVVDAFARAGERGRVERVIVE